MCVAGRQSGFTLLELMITVVVLVVLVMLAVPSYQTTVRNNCAVSSANSMLSLLTLAKSEAQRRGRTVTVCPSDSVGTSCVASGSWATGMLAYVDIDKDGTYDAGEEIRAIAPLSTCSTIATTSNLSNYIAFDSLASPTVSGSFTITPKNQTVISRKLFVSKPSKLRICNPQTDSSC